MVCKHKKSDPETFLRYFGSSSLDNSLRLSLPWPLPLARKHSANKSHEMKKHAFPSDFGSDLTGFGQLMRSFRTQDQTGSDDQTIRLRWKCCVDPCWLQVYGKPIQQRQYLGELEGRAKLVFGCRTKS